MKKIFNLAAALMIAASASAQTLAPFGTVVKASDSNIQYIGRIVFDNPDSPVFTFPGVQINTGFTGSSLKMIAKPNSGYFMVQIDGSEAFKVAFNSKNDSIVSLATALPQGTHQAKLTYITEGYDRRPEFRGFIVDKGCSLAPAPALSDRKIEFIGNSITCGYGAEALSASVHFSDEVSNHYYTYASRAARALDAQYVTTARSGIGVYRNYNGPKTGDKINMNTEYTHTLLYDNKYTWDFSRYQPQVVCINLGTNDTSTTGADYNLLLQGYKNLYKQVREHNPQAKIVFLCGTMMHDAALKMAQKAMNTATEDAHKSGDKEVYRFDFPEQLGDLGYGADSHPSYWQHEKMAGELTAFLRALMQWW